MRITKNTTNLRNTCETHKKKKMIQINLRTRKIMKIIKNPTETNENHETLWKST